MMKVGGESKSSIYQFDSFQVDPASFRLLRDGQPLDLEPKALQLLIFFLENPGRLLRKQELLEAIWGDLAITENALTREVALLRRVLGDNTKSPKYIETVPTQGYRFIAELVMVSGEGIPFREPEAKSLLQTEVAASPLPAQAQPKAKTKSLFVMASILLLLVVVATLWTIKRTSSAAPADHSQFFRLTQFTSSDGMDVFPNFSPDGKSIAYSSDRSGSFEIYLRQLAENGGEIQLTRDDGGNIEPAWSFDGQWIAYHSTKRGGIWIIPVLGGVPRRLTDFGSRPAWSHDGKKIAFQSGIIAAMFETEFGPTPESTLWVANVEDGGLKQLTYSQNHVTDLTGDSSPQWAMDDSWILFGSAARIWTIGANGENLREVAPNLRGVDAVYGNDGKTLDFLSWDTQGTNLLEIPLDRNGAPTGAARVIQRSTLGAFHYLANSGASGRLAFSVIGTRDNLYSIDVSSDVPKKEPLPLTQDTRQRKTHPAFSPDGLYLSFLVDQTGRLGQLWTVTSEGKNMRKVPLPSWAADPGWSSKDVLNYWTYDSQDRKNLWHWDLNSGTSTNVFQTEEKIYIARLSPDGKTVAYQKNKDGVTNVWTLSLETQRARQLTFSRSLVGWPCWSHDGRFLAVEARNGEYTEIEIVPAAGGTPVRLTHDTGQHWPFSWSPNDEEIAYAGFHEGVWNVFSISRRTGVEKQLTHYARHNTFVRYPEWSPDGHRIVYEYGSSSANIWLLEPR